jgi:AraC-like DNA-binding protein
MPGSGTSTFTDPDDYQTSLRWAQMELLANSGDFEVRLTWAELHCLRLLRSREVLPRIAYLSLTPALIFVTFATAADPPLVWGGVDVELGNIMFHSRGERLHQRMRGPCVWGLIALPLKDLEDYGRALFGKPLVVPSTGRVLRPPPRNTARLQRLHAQACRLAETRPKILAHPEVARAIEQDLLQALITCLTAAPARDDSATRAKHAAIIVRFEEIIAENPIRPRRVSEICELIGVTDKTLRSCCTEFLGISPGRYLLLRRLKQVRTALRDADPAAASVAKLARHHGFTELGRFAAVYRRAFGETPSTTLARTRTSGFLRPFFSDSA